MFLAKEAYKDALQRADAAFQRLANAFPRARITAEETETGIRYDVHVQGEFLLAFSIVRPIKDRYRGTVALESLQRVEATFHGMGETGDPQVERMRPQDVERFVLQTIGEFTLIMSMGLALEQLQKRAVR